MRDRSIRWPKIGYLIGSARSGRTRYAIKWIQYRWNYNHGDLRP
jgi:hypothetical protein